MSVRAATPRFFDGGLVADESADPWLRACLRVKRVGWQAEPLAWSRWRISFSLAPAFAGVVAFVAVMLTIATQAPTVAGERGQGQQAITRQQIFDKVNAGERLSPAEVSFVKSTDLAALLPDPSHVETGLIVESVPVVAQSASAGNSSVVSPTSISATYCNTKEMYWTQYSYLGQSIYRMHHRWRTCWNGSKVTSVSNRETWFDHTNGLFYDRGTSSDWYSGVNTSLAQTFTQHHIEYCVVTYGCYYSGYPWIRAYRYGSGHQSWSHGV